MRTEYIFANQVGWQNDVNAFGWQTSMEKGQGGDLSYWDNVSTGSLLGNHIVFRSYFTSTASTIHRSTCPRHRLKCICEAGDKCKSGPN